MRPAFRLILRAKIGPNVPSGLSLSVSPNLSKSTVELIDIALVVDEELLDMTANYSLVSGIEIEMLLWNPSGGYF